MRPLALLLFYSLIHISASGQSYDEDAVRQTLVNSFEKALSTYDTAQIKNFYTDDFLLLEDGAIWNLDTVYLYFNLALKQSEIPKRVNTFDFSEVKVDGNQAWVAYDNKAEFLINNKVVRKVHWLESAVLVKQDSNWKIRMLHSTVINDEKVE